MSKAIIKTIGILVLAGCATNNVEQKQHASLPVVEGELLKEKWQLLNRFPARYPFAAAVSNKTGCATVEYVITPDYEIENIHVKKTTDRVFNKASKKAVLNWNWSELPKGLLSTAIKTQTHFKFCIESNENPCEKVIEKLSCTGKDSISSIGTLVKRS